MHWLLLLSIIVKFKSATEGMQQECYSKLLDLAKDPGGNADIIADYLIAYKAETDTTDLTRASNCLNIIRFIQKVGKDKPFRSITSEDILSYFNSIRKSEDAFRDIAEQFPRGLFLGSWRPSS